MLQSNKMLGSLLGFGRKDGTGFIKMSAAYEELHSCLQKHQDAHIKNCHYLFRKTGQDMSKKWVSIFDFSLQKNKWKSFVFDLDRKQFRIVDSKLCAPCH